MIKKSTKPPSIQKEKIKCYTQTNLKKQRERRYAYESESCKNAWSQ